MNTTYIFQFYIHVLIIVYKVVNGNDETATPLFNSLPQGERVKRLFPFPLAGKVSRLTNKSDTSGEGRESVSVPGLNKVKTRVRGCRFAVAKLPNF